MEDNSKTLFNFSEQTFPVAKGEGSQLEVNIKSQTERSVFFINAYVGLVGSPHLLAAEMKGKSLE